MTHPRREIIGKFTENFEYTVNGEPLSHPVWIPKKAKCAVERHPE